MDRRHITNTKEKQKGDIIKIEGSGKGWKTHMPKIGLTRTEDDDDDNASVQCPVSRCTSYF